MALAIAPAIPVAVSAQAQWPGMFRWPTRQPDISRYGTVEDCRGVISRTEIVLARRVGRADTASQLRTRYDGAPVPEILDVARRCGASVPFESFFVDKALYVREMAHAHELLLTAGRTADARTFGTRWVAGIPASDDTMRVFVLSRLAAQLAQARPADLEEAWKKAQEYDPVKYWEFSFGTFSVVRGAAKRLADTLLAHQVMAHVQSPVARLPKRVTQSDGWQGAPGKPGVGMTVFNMLQDERQRALLDSLRASTTSYWRYLDALRVAAKLDQPFEQRQSRPVVGDAWFPQQPSRPRPTPGVVSVILTVDDNECGFCLGPVALVRRLHHQFPEVEFTLLANTKGYHGLVMEPPTLEQESALIDSVYRKVHGLPATTVIHHTRFWRMPELDRRRVNERSPNADLYQITHSMTEGRMYLVDRMGNLVAEEAWSPRSEERVARLIEALVQQVQ